MPKQKTLEAASTTSELSRTRGFRTIPKYHVNLALTTYLRSMKLIDDDQEVTNFNKSPDALDVKIERV